MTRGLGIGESEFVGCFNCGDFVSAGSFGLCAGCLPVFFECEAAGA